MKIGDRVIWQGSCHSVVDRGERNASMFNLSNGEWIHSSEVPDEHIIVEGEYISLDEGQLVFIGDTLYMVSSELVDNKGKKTRVFSGQEILGYTRPK